MTKEELLEKANSLPLAPGVYLMHNKEGTVIYVGKAKSLRKRVSSYFLENKDHAPKVRVMVRQIAAIRHIVVDSETDALLLLGRTEELLAEMKVLIPVEGKEA